MRRASTLTAELRLSGRAGDEKLRGTLHAGFAAPASLRVEALAPFGQPFFILAGRDNRATLLLPREDRVLRDAPVAEHARTADRARAWRRRSCA